MDHAVAAGTLGLNERAARIAEAMAADADALRVAVSMLPCAARVIDCGIAVPGGLEAGRVMAEACMGGLGRVQLTAVEIDGLRLPGVHVHTDHPAVSCLASQYAGWAIRPEGYFVLGEPSTYAWRQGDPRALGSLEVSPVNPGDPVGLRRGGTVWPTGSPSPGGTWTPGCPAAEPSM